VPDVPYVVKAFDLPKKPYVPHVPYVV